MVYKFFSGVLVESYGTWLLFQRLDDASKDSDIPKNVPFAFAINNRNTKPQQQPAQRYQRPLLKGKRKWQLQITSRLCPCGGRNLIKRQAVRIKTLRSTDS